MNFNLEIKFSQLLPKLKELIKKAKFQDILKLLSSHTDFIGLSILLISLFTFNLALNQDKKKKQHEYLKDLTPGKIQVFEGKVFKIYNGDKTYNNVIATESVLENIEVSKKNSIIINRLLDRKETKKINSFILYDKTGSIRLNFAPNYNNFNLSDYFILKRINSVMNRKVPGSSYEENKIEKLLKNRDIVRMKISLPLNVLMNKKSSHEFELEFNNVSNLDGEIKFFEPTVISLINFNIILNFLKVSFISAHIVGIVYFSYKIYKKLIIKKEQNNQIRNYRILALPSA